MRGRNKATDWSFVYVCARVLVHNESCNEWYAAHDGSMPTFIARIGPRRPAAARVFGSEQAALQDRDVVQRRHNACAYGAEGAGQGRRSVQYIWPLDF